MLHLETQEIPQQTAVKLHDFFAHASSASSRALLLDYDGTLARFCCDPERAIPYPAVPALLDRIRSKSNTRLVVVTGRRAYDGLRLLGLKGIEVWGCHGLERLQADGTYEMLELNEKLLQAISEADELLSVAGLSALAEYKPGGIAIHWRGLGKLSSEVKQKVLHVWSKLHHRDGFCLMPFDEGMEIRVDCSNKGDAVRTILSEMDIGASVAYLGDDETDENAFAALRDRGLRVLVRNEFRPTEADVWIRPPEGVVAFLADWANACGGAS